MTVIPVQVISADEAHEWSARYRSARDDPARPARGDWELAELAERGTTLFFWGDAGWFHWLCPGCGRWLGGQIGEEPVSGWDAPRWVNSGTPDRPTLTPSLGCGGWRRGTCAGGHYWLRDGILVPA